MRIEEWNGYRIRFVEKDGEWWAVLKDVCDALELKQRLEKDLLSKYTLETNGGVQEMLIVSEFGFYDVVFQSRKKEAKKFRHWAYELFCYLRKVTGLEGFQVFRMLDKEHQKEMMKKLNHNIGSPKQKHFIKANTIANKAISTKHGYTKMIKKGEMSPQMLIEREPILKDTVELMSVNEKFGLGISVSKAVYQKYHS
jgi:prophage antirepressor-like protein